MLLSNLLELESSLPWVFGGRIIASMKNLEKIFKALANHRRLLIVRLLAQKRELSVAEIAEHLKLSLTATSKHLGILYKVDILDRRQESLTVFYRLASDSPELFRKVLPILSNSRE